MPHIFSITIVLNGYTVIIEREGATEYKYQVDKSGNNDGPISSGGGYATAKLAKNAGLDYLIDKVDELKTTASSLQD